MAVSLHVYSTALKNSSPNFKLNANEEQKTQNGSEPLAALFVLRFVF